MDREPPDPPKREWIVCGLCGWTVRMLKGREAAAFAVAEHASKHTTLPPELMPGTPVGRGC